MKHLKGMVVLLAAVVAMSAIGCKKKEVGPAEKAGQEIDKAVNKAGEGLGKATEKGKEAVDKAAEKTKDTVKDATHK